MKVLLVTNYTSLPGEPGYNRFRYICEILSQNNIEVELVTSSFDHYSKTRRNTLDNLYSKQPYIISFLDEPGYKKNISFGRIKSQRKFAVNLKDYLEARGRDFDAIYCCVPSHEPALVTARFANQNEIPFIIDVQDLWPEAMKLIIDIPLLNDLLFYKFKRDADEVYKRADSIIAVSDTYLKRGLSQNSKAQNNATVFIGTNMEQFDAGVIENVSKINKPDDEFWITYIGTLGHSYDINTVTKAVKIVNEKGYQNVKFIILGRGPLENSFKEYAKNIKVDVRFLGYIDYKMMAAYLKKTDIAVNAIKKKAAQSIINKIGDYLSGGCAILNGSLNEEFRKMVEDYEIGLNYEPENSESLALKIIELYHDNEKRLKMGINSRKLADQKFNRVNSYKEIVKVVNSFEKNKFNN